MSFDSDAYKRIDELSKKVNNSKLLDSTRQALKEALKSFAITDDESARLYVEFEAQVAATMMQVVFRTAIEMPQIDMNIQNGQKDLEYKNAQIALLGAQKLATDTETELKSNETAKQIEKMTAEIALLGAQKLATDSEKLIKETQSTNDTATKTAQAALMNAQKINEEYRKQDIQAGVSLKNQQALQVWESALYEAQRRKMLIEADKNNSAINKAKAAADFLQAIASRVDPTTADISYVKDTIAGISTTAVADNTQAEVGSKPLSVSLTPL